MPAAILPVQCAISVGGSNLLLNVPSQGYRLEASSRNERSITWRKQEVQNPFVEGSFVIAAVKENVMEQVAVYVNGVDAYQLHTRVQALIDAFSQIRYQMTWTVDANEEIWDCFPADCTISTSREWQHSRLATVKAMVPRRPKAVRA